MLRTVKILAWSIVFQGVIAAYSTGWAADIDGQNLFEKRCAVCHKLPDPGQPPPVGWEQQLELMAPLARLEDRQKQEILDYLLSHSRQAIMDASVEEDRLLFEEKCGHCHTVDRVLLSSLTGESLRHVVNRMQSRSGTDWLSDQEIEQVLAYLSELPRETVQSAPFPDSTTPDQIFAVRCSACHTLERVYQRLGEAPDLADYWSHTVSRMRGKAPQWMSESEAGQILEYLRSINPAQK